MTTTPAPRPSVSLSAVAAWVLVALVPVLAWAVWVATSDGYAGDARHVLWFATVALGVLVAGVLAPRDTRTLVGLSLLGVVATIGTLFAWWSSEDETGLFVVGIILATPAVALAAPVLLLLGRTLGRRRPR